MLLRIRNWTKLYENNRTRGLQYLSWVPVPNSMDGDGYTELIEEHGAECYGAWMAIVLIASRCSPRGTLLRSRGVPHDSRSLARISRIPVDVMQRAIAALINIGWIEQIDEDSTGSQPSANTDTSTPQESAAVERQSSAALGRQESAALCARLQNGTERNGTEGGTRVRAVAPGCGKAQPTAKPPLELSQSTPDRMEGFEQFCEAFTGPVPDNTRAAWKRYVHNRELIAACVANTPLWMETPTYRDGFHNAASYLKAGVWRAPPKITADGPPSAAAQMKAAFRKMDAT